MWEDRLNTTYAALMAKAKPELREGYRKMQRAWIAYRDARWAAEGIVEAVNTDRQSNIVVSCRPTLATLTSGPVSTHTRFNLKRGITILIVTHNHELAAQCDRIIELVDGRLTGDRHISMTHNAAAPG